MNATLDVIRSRYSCRSFGPEAVPLETLQAIGQAAIQAPSAYNAQPWSVIVVADRALIGKIEQAALGVIKRREPDVHKRFEAGGNGMFYNAAAMVVIAQDIARPDLFAPQLDVGIATSHAVLAATALGVDSCICGFARLAFEGPDAPALRADLGLADGYDFAISILLGRATGPGTAHEPDPAKLLVRR
jgi:nitroreductase